MERTDVARPTPLAALVLLATLGRCEAGLITFSGDFSSMPPITTPDQIGAAQTLDVPFSGPATGGKGTASGDVIFSNNAAGTTGSTTLANFAFTSNLGAGSGPSLVSFVIDATQAFAYSGPPALDATNFFAGRISFTGPDQAASFSSGGSVNGLTIPAITGSLGSDSASSFPLTIILDPVTTSLRSIPASGPVTSTYSLSATLGSASGAASAGEQIAFPSRLSLSFGPAAAVPAPASWVMSSIAAVASLGYAWRRRF
jgi:hypothetical protein